MPARRVTIGTFQFWRAGHFSWKLFWPFALLSVPAAYVGGYLQPSASVLRILIGLCCFSRLRDWCFAGAVRPNRHPLPTGGNWRRRRPWISFRTNWDRRWNISHAAIVVLPMGAHPPGRSCFGAIHLGELDRRAGRVLHKGSFNSFAWSYPCSSGDHWRHYGLVSGKQASCCPGNFAFLATVLLIAGVKLMFTR